jgi:hypothetical protein
MRIFHIFAIFAIIISIVTIALLFCNKEEKIERYNDYISFEENLLISFQKNEMDNYFKYLKFLNDNKNSSLNLVSEQVYNFFKNKKNIKLDEIKQKM